MAGDFCPFSGQYRGFCVVSPNGHPMFASTRTGVLLPSTPESKTAHSAVTYDHPPEST